jgi:hypothetical protein
MFLFLIEKCPKIEIRQSQDWATIAPIAAGILEFRGEIAGH